MGEKEGRVKHLAGVVAELETRLSGSPHSILGVSEAAPHGAVSAAFVQLACKLHGGGLHGVDAQLAHRARELYTRVRVAFDTIVDATNKKCSAHREPRSLKPFTSTLFVARNMTRAT